MHKNVSRILIAIIALGTLIIITIGVLYPGQSDSVAPGSQIGLQPGNSAPNFTVTLLSGQKVSLSDYRGKPVMLNFWHVNCPGCRLEMPEMQKFYTEQQSTGGDFVILAVNLVDTVDAAQQYTQSFGLTFPIATEQNPAISELYALRGTPTTYFLDRQGVIASMTEGPVDETALDHILETIQ